MSAVIPENKKFSNDTAMRRKSEVVVPHKAKWHQRLLATMIYLLVRMISATIRFRHDDRSGMFNGAPKEKIIFAIWHNRLALSAVLYRRYILRFARQRRMAGMVSASRDGGLLAEILKHFSIEPVRGSSSRRGPQAMLELTTWAEQGYDIAITPDGPRGPRYVVQDGVTSLAQLTGLPIIPVTYNLSSKIQLKSWDKFQIPFPFSKCEVVFGKPIRIPRDVSDAEREQLRQELENELRAITRD